jgi:hypothetical protein
VDFKMRHASRLAQALPVALFVIAMGLWPTARAPNQIKGIVKKSSGIHLEGINKYIRQVQAVTSYGVGLIIGKSLIGHSQFIILHVKKADGDKERRFTPDLPIQF